MKHKIGKRFLAWALGACLVISAAAPAFASSAGPDANMEGIVTKTAFYDLVNAAAQYDVMEVGEDADAPITRAEAAEALSQYLRIALDHSDAAALFADVEEADAFAIGAMVYYDIMDGVTEDAFDPDGTITAEEAEDILYHASTAEMIVQVGSDVLIRETFPLTMAAPALEAEDDILLDQGIMSLLGGCTVPQASREIDAAENQIVVHFSQDQQALTSYDGGRISLKELAAAYGGSIEFSYDTSGAVTGAAFRLDRAMMKSNRNLNEKELAQPYAKFYLRYNSTPLPERPDEIAWNSTKDALYSAQAKKADDTILNPETYYKLLDPDYIPEEGWSTSSDGRYTTMCTIVDLNFEPGTEVEDADMISWWFAWHTLEDMRYMMWNPSCHYGVWVTTGEYDDRTPEQIEAQPMRIFDTTLGSWYERAYGSANRAHENTMLNSYTGTSQYLDYDGTNSLDYQQLVINFVDMSDPSVSASGEPIYFSSEEEFMDTGHSIREEFLIQAGVTGEPSKLTGVGVPMASMLHIMRQIDGEWKLITHFSSFLFGSEGYVSEHQVREMAILGSFLPELYAMEKDHDLQEYADPNNWRLP